MDRVDRPKKLRGQQKHRDDLAALKTKDRAKMNGFGFLDFIKRAFGAKVEGE